MKNEKSETIKIKSIMKIEIENQNKSQIKKSSITQRLFKRRHHYTKPITKSRFLRRTRNIPKKSNQTNIEFVYNDS